MTRANLAPGAKPFERQSRSAIRRRLGALLVATLAAPASAVPLDARETAFLNQHRCAVVATLKAILATPMETSDDQNRFLITSYRRRQENYIQCAFIDRDRNIHCEAASGFYLTSSGPKPRIVDDAGLKALASKGFSLDDSKGNYVKEFPVAGPQDSDAIAELLLSSLYEAYPFARGTPIVIVAPDAKLDPAKTQCQPVG